MGFRLQHDWSRNVSVKSLSGDDSGEADSDSIDPVESLHDLPCLVLLGEPGIGKTRVFDHLRKTVIAAKAVEVDLGRYDLDALERRLREEVRPLALQLGPDEGLHLFFDAVDESPVSRKRLARVLIQELAAILDELPIGRLRLRFASRPLGWPGGLQDGLEGLLRPTNTEPVQRWLCPLLPQDIERAAREIFGDRSGEFLRRLEEQQLMALATRPVTLDLLFALWRREGDLPRQRVDVYDRGLRCLLAEARYEPDDGPPLDRYYRLSQTLAGSMLLTNRASVWNGREGEDSPLALTVGEIEKAHRGVAGHDQTRFAQDLEAVLGIIPLGESAQAGYWRFAHRSFAEYLAAKWLAESQRTDSELMFLITSDSPDSESRRIVPQLAGVATWLADLRVGVFERLLGYEPALALQTDHESRDPEYKAKVIDALLHTLDDDRVDEWDWNDFLGRLHYDGIAEQLRSWIGAPEKHLFARRTAIRIVERCHVNGLEDVLLKVLDEPRDRSNLHDLAAGALIATYQRAGRWDDIRQFAKDRADDDPNESVLGKALRALWPEHIELKDLAALCRKPRRRSHFGRYHIFLTQEFVDGLRDEQLVDALRWFAEFTALWREDAHILGPAWTKLFTRLTLASSLTDREVAEGLVLPLFNAPEALLYGRYADAVAVFMSVATPSRQMCALEVCVEQLAAHASQSWHVATQLAGPDGPEQALAIAFDRVGTPQEIVAFELAQRLSDLGRADHVERLRNAAERSDVARSAFKHLLGLGDTADAIAEEIQRRRRHEPDRPRRPPLDPPPEERVAKRLSQVLAGDVEAFPDLLFRQLVLSPDATMAGQNVPVSIAETPGWIAADGATRANIGQAALAWLLHGDPEEQDWLGTTTLAGTAITGLLAAGHLFDHHTELFESVPAEVWARWSLALLSGTSSLNWQDHDLEPLRRGIRADPVSFAERLGRHLKKEGPPSVYLRRLRTVWTPELSTLLQSFIKDASDDESRADDVFEFATTWLEHDEGGAFVVDDETRFVLPVRAAIVAAHFKTGAEAHWERLWPALSTDDELAELVFLRVARGQWGHATFATTMATPARLGSLVERLIALFPPGGDPQHDTAHFVTDRESVAHLRDGVLRHLANLGTGEAAETLLRLQRNGLDPDGRLGLRGFVQDAIQRALATEWRPRALKQLIELVLRGRPAVYLSSRFGSPLRLQVRDRLAEDYEVIVTEGMARPSGVLDAISQDMRQADVVVQVLEWSQDLGEGDHMGVAYLQQEQYAARVLGRPLLAGVLEDAAQPPDRLKRYIEGLQPTHILVADQDISCLITAIEQSVGRYFDDLFR